MSCAAICMYNHRRRNLHSYLSSLPWLQLLLLFLLSGSELKFSCRESVLLSYSLKRMVMMGQLGRFVDGIKSKLRAGGGGKRGAAKKAVYDKMDKTDSMRVEIKSRQAQKLIAKNLVAADSIGRRNKRFFLAF